MKVRLVKLNVKRLNRGGARRTRIRGEENRSRSLTSTRNLMKKTKCRECSRSRRMTNSKISKKKLLPWSARKSKC
jgi:hypothetical protein